MDAGRFLRRKREFWAWLLIPLLAILLVQLSGVLYLDAVSRNLQGLQAHSALLPELEATLQQTDRAVHRYALGGDIDERTTDMDLSSLFNKVAEEQGFTVNAVQIEPAQVKKGTEMSIQRVSVSGFGPIDATMRYIDALSDPTRPVSVEEARLMVMDSGHDPRYRGHFVFLFYDFDPDKEHARVAHPVLPGEES